MSSTDLTGCTDEQQVVFRFEELFLSRTDEGGVILSGNSVFQRASGYGWAEMRGKPHKLIRHPDMPRAVFWLLWNALEMGEPIGAYVKNRAKDGRYYWVFAIVTPVEGGYLSVRLKPGSVLQGAVDKEYQVWAGAEQRDRTTPEASAGLVLERLATLGFADYPAFMAEALSAEITTRDQTLGLAPDETILFYRRLAQAARALLTQAEAISDACDDDEYAPLNFEIRSSQLGEIGASISAASGNYRVIFTELRDGISQFIGASRQVFKTINDGLFLVCTARIQREMVAFFEAEPGAEDDRDQEMLLLNRQQQTYTEKAAAGLEAIAFQTESFRRDSAEMAKLAATLEVTRIIGKVECARLALGQDRLDELLEEFENFQKTIAAGLRDVDRSSLDIRQNADQLLVRFG